jgi:hypothetical protein
MDSDKEMVGQDLGPGMDQYDKHSIAEDNDISK